MYRALNLALAVVTLTASVFTIVVAWTKWSATTTPDGRVGLLVLFISFAMVVIFAVVQEYRYSRKARYAETFPNVNLTFSEIHNLLTSDPSPTEIVAACTLITNRLAALLSLVSATHCSVCIKVVERGSTDRPKVLTLCRDDASRPREKGSTSVDHFIDQNTDFQYLFERVGTPTRFFFCNNLPKLRDYNNTSFSAYKQQPVRINFPIIGVWLRERGWPLPYKSTIVVPISLQDNPSRLSGFLCADSRSRYAFSNRYDPDILTGAADCLYQILDRYSAVTWQAKEGKS